jgi:hypothetical protein
MAALLSLVPVRDFASVPAAPARARLRLVSGGALPLPTRPAAQWRRAADGRLVCRWQQPADPDPLR